MEKLELDLDDLEVDSFKASSKQEDAQGTIQGNEEEYRTDGWLSCETFCHTCAGNYTCKIVLC